METLQPTHRKRAFLLLLCFVFARCFSQSYFFGEGPVNWELRKPFEMPPEAEKYASSDLVILSDKAEFDFNSSTSEKIVRSIKFKINTKKGLEELRHFELPESFDYAFDRELNRQGRRARIKTPYMREYSVKVFAARKFSRQRWSNLKVKDHYEIKRWIKPGGEFADEEQVIFDLGIMAIGDVIEIYYEAFFNSQYGPNIFYFNGPYPKLSCEYNFVYRMDKSIKQSTFVSAVNVEESKIYTSKVDYGYYNLVTTKMQYLELPANNYPLNSFESQQLPHVYADFTYYRAIMSYLDERYTFTKTVKPKNYEWSVPIDTTNREQVKIYDKHFSLIRKFLSTMPPCGTDSENVVFAKALCDSFNHFRYITPNHLYYNESAIYELYSGEHLSKRRLAGHSLWKLYMDIFRENQVFYYQANIQDKRLGEHDPGRRIHFAYEHNIMAFPLKDSYIYFMPRQEGLKYHPNELPFYFEDVNAALMPLNALYAKSREARAFKIVKTHGSSYHENTRTEEAGVKINLDSLSMRLSIRETLSGQFSTLLRPLYLGEYIDSTVAPHYFKKCLDKPSASNKKVKLNSKSMLAPFHYVFDCSAGAALADSSKLSLKDWFSFTLSKEVIPQMPGLDYYFDFELSDSYSFLLEFSRPIEIKNRETFTKKISNDYFKLESSISKDQGNKYLLKVTVITKQKIIPKEKAGLLMELVEQLDLLNNFTLQLSRN